MAFFNGELLRLVPNVLRARDFHLYLAGGKRLTDLWRGGGKALLGHKRPHVLGELKNAAERGLFCAFPHPLERRFVKALSELFPSRAFRLYLNESSLYNALKKAGINGPVPLWRPFSEKIPALKVRSDTFFIPVLPWPLGPEVLVLDKDKEDSFSPGDLIPPVLLAPAARALYDLAAAIKENKTLSFPKIDRALGKVSSNEKGANADVTCVWLRQGIYLKTKTETSGAEYASLFKKFLEGGFLLPPEPEEPAILPFTMSQGEEAKLSELLKTR